MGSNPMMVSFYEEKTEKTYKRTYVKMQAGIGVMQL